MLSGEQGCMNEVADVSNKVSNTFRALKHRNFAYFWVGQCISLIGTWMQNTGQSWLVLSLTNSPFLLGLVTAVQFIPMLLFSLLAGVIVDRLPKKRIVIITQTTLMILAFILSALVWTGYIRYWHLLILAALLGIANTIDMPARQSYMIELVGKEDLMNAIALNSSIFNVARIIGPAVAGVLMGVVGISTCFLLNGISFIAVLIGLFLINVEGRPVKNTETGRKMIEDIKEGLIYTSKAPVIYFTLIAITIVGIFVMNFNVLVPTFARSVLKQNESGFGILMSVMGIGSFMGALGVASRSKSKLSSRILYGSCLAAAIFLAATGVAKDYLIMAVLLALTGYFVVTFTATANSTIQLNTDNEYRGRVMSIYSLVFAGTSPFGSMFSGSVADKYGAGIGFVASGVIAFILICILLVFKYHMEQKMLRQG